MFKQRKRRFFALIQLDQYQFLLSSFPDNASLPKENLLLDQSFFVEYATDEGQDISVNYDLKSVNYMHVLFPLWSATNESQDISVNYGTKSVNYMHIEDCIIVHT